MILTKYRFELSDSLSRLLSDTQVESVNSELGFARRYLNTLVARLEKELSDKIKEDENLINYENNNWALLQAERLGYRRAIRKVIEIIRPIEEKHD